MRVHRFYGILFSLVVLLSACSNQTLQGKGSDEETAHSGLPQEHAIADREAVDPNRGYQGDQDERTEHVLAEAKKDGRASEVKSETALTSAVKKEPAERSKVVALKPEMSQVEQSVLSSLVEFDAQKVSDTTTKLTLPDYILFDFDSYALRPEAEKTIEKLVQVIDYAGEKAEVTIIGHTDNIGTKEYNQTLSEKRAQAVLEALAEKGMVRERLKALGKGMTEPVANNGTEEGRQKNRRVEVLIEGFRGAEDLEGKAAD